MIRDIVYQISVFGDFTSIKPSDETVKSMIAKLSDHGLLPSVFQEQSFTISADPAMTTTPEIANRLQMMSIEKNINVMFARNRIDLSKSVTDSNIGTDDLNVLLDVLDKATSGLPFTRLAFNTTSLLDAPKDFLLQKMQPRLTFFNEPTELMLRVNKQTPIAINEDLNENSNVILLAQKTMGQLLINNSPISVDDGLILQFDINTLPEISDPRFFSAHAKGYVLGAEQVRQSLLTELLS